MNESKLKRWGHRFLLAGLTAMCCAALPAVAQVGEISDSPEVGQASGPPDQPPGQTPSVERPVPTLKVTKFVVEGSSLLKPEDLASLLSGYEGKDLSLAQMKEVADRVTQRYRESGFLLTHAFIPKQDFKGGQVRIQVVEGKVNKIDIEGTKHYDPELIKSYMDGAMQDGVLQSDRFQRSLLLLNELPNLKVTAHLKKGQEKGSADLVLKVEEAKSFHVDLDYNNFGSKSTGEHRFGLGFDWGNPLGNGDEMYFRSILSVAPQGSTFFNVGYRTPINHDGTTVGFDYANGAFTAGREFAILDLRGNANIYTLSLSHALDRSLDFSSSVGVAFSYKDSDSSLLGLPFARDHYGTMRINWQGDWRDLNGRTLAQASVTQGLGGQDTNDPRASRVGASSTFTKFNLDLARVQTIAPSVYGILRATGQIPTGSLYTGEQFALGGPDTVRGYPQATWLGDGGYVVSAEVRWSPLENKDILQFAAFFDHGRTGINNPQVGERKNHFLTGAGVGVRSNLSEETSVRLDLGFPLTSSDNVVTNSPVIYGAVKTRF